MKKKSLRSASISVPKDRHRLLVGPKGNSLRNILQATGCAVAIPSEEDPTDVITVIGPEATLLQALGMAIEVVRVVCFGGCLDVANNLRHDPRSRWRFR